MLLLTNWQICFKVSNNIILVCKAHYLNCPIRELGISIYTPSNSTYKRNSFDKDEILNNSKSFIPFLKSETQCEDLLYFYWISKLHKNRYKEKYIEESSSCSTKEMLIYILKIKSAVKMDSKASNDIIICGYLKNPKIYLILFKFL